MVAFESLDIEIGRDVPGTSSLGVTVTRYSGARVRPTQSPSCVSIQDGASGIALSHIICDSARQL